MRHAALIGVADITARIAASATSPGVSVWAYDPCAPNIVSVLAGKSGRVVRHHPVRHLLGRRVARWPGSRINTDACPKARAGLALPYRLVALAPLASPAIVTAVGMAVVGASAFGGAAMLRGANAPFGAPSTGTIIVPGGGTAVQPPPGNGTTGQGGGAHQHAGTWLCRHPGGCHDRGVGQQLDTGRPGISWHSRIHHQPAPHARPR